ncbi:MULTISPECIES: 1-deoxy-D-xylulose-5-phosphate reductoisomerase [Aneurinibacillus]|uniref:1-deoxy-D-xylulose 5-phosphate reductoisomerase n=1 Tax=Aneurinibacillus thermoaerophilus TaxID=143495 RepID=A0A1G7WFZ0_ANETH|nr:MULTISPECIES: 1-deoxy-D-xylulose-5-phosphate reductoisomerase [Aneurinibacillus]AMA72701.1 1-deoxy-D-xylulose 5-phosphate reductoisomerase [Aneurinibacillus sp. XH2]MED0736990.1 1-deoxy-D-xylulose-5-phosphate reductoisomerase [Aneurinibacillus thermoaerophilus]MED0756831.1 1-deoxy-D-xylulose-5-phosphate reductoisomerase [Aneurinibacillus thermoaerophilus]MED0760881.1 1-deoxy-D-xylulose-5-phosphate reductoisomerase [Aneurinibacillus thermoaerophilus]QYY41547.1 1-deoxy-D-xylulose-5-phosphate 
MKKIAILGSTGSIGTQALDVVRQHPERFSVAALAAGQNIGLLAEQAREFKPRIVSVSTKELAENIKLQLPSEIQVTWGEEGAFAVATHPDATFVISAMVGSAGLAPTLAAIEAGKCIGLANKETLVTAGHIVMQKAKTRDVSVIPIDSEHSAIFQCLQGEDRRTIKRLIITASGGSFRDLSRDQLRNVTVEQALAHPNWSMGAKITIDSATMMNKGLEIIEAHWLFDLPYSKIDTILHKESIIHSMVEFTDRAVMAQLGTPDMRIPIQYALSYPERVPLETEPLDLVKISSLHFATLDFERYPCLRFAYEAGRIGGTMPTVLNAANEVAVARFLRKEIPFLAIEDTIAHVMAKHQVAEHPNLDEIFEADMWARQVATQYQPV